jgi:hypothetical protein
MSHIGWELVDGLTRRRSRLNRAIIVASIELGHHVTSRRAEESLDLRQTEARAASRPLMYSLNHCAKCPLPLASLHRCALKECCGVRAVASVFVFNINDENHGSIQEFGDLRLGELGE